MNKSLRICYSTLIAPPCYRYAFAITMSLLSLLFVYTLLHLCHTGIDLTDEGFYLNWIANPGLYKSSVTQFGYIYHPLYQLLGEDLVLLRQADMLIMLGLSWVLCVQLLRKIFSRDELDEPYSLFYLYASTFGLATGIFVFFGSIWWLPTPSYNSLSLESALIISIGLMRLTDNSLRITGYVILGIGYWLAFMAKPPAAISLGLFSFLYLLLIEGKKFKLTRYLFTCIIAIVLIYVSAWAIDGSITNFIVRLKSGVEQRSLLAGGRSFSGFTALYGWLPNEPKRSFFYLLIATVFLVINLSTTKDSTAQYVCFYTALGIGLLMCINAYLIPLDRMESLAQGLLTQSLILSVPLGALLSCVITKKMSTHPSVKQPYSILCLSAFFLFLPFLCTFGTAMDFWTNSLRLGFFYILAVLPLTALINLPFYIRWRMVLGIIVCSQLITITLVQQATEHPYHQKQPLRSQTKTITIPHSKEKKTTPLIVSDNDARYINELKLAAYHNGFSYGDSIIDLSSSPTSLYILGAKALGTAWYDTSFAPDSSHAYDFIHAILLTIPCDKLTKAWFLAPLNNEINLVNILEPNGIDSRSLKAVGGIIEQLDTYHGYVRQQQLIKPIGSHQDAILHCEKNRQIQHEAQSAIQKILNKPAPSTQAIIEDSVRYFHDNKVNQAIALLQKAIIINPVNADLYNNLCVAYGLKKNYADAMSACSNALRIAPQFQLAKNNLAWVTHEKEMQK